MYLVPQDLRAKPQIIKGVDIFDFLFVVGMGVIGYVLAESVHLIAPGWRIPFIIFNIIACIYLVLPAPFNKGKKNWQAIQYALMADKYTYKPDETEARADTIDIDFIDKELSRAELLIDYAAWQEQQKS